MDGLAMSIASLSTDMAMSKTMSAVSTAVMKQNMDTNEAMGAGMVKMMENSVTPNLGGNVDVKLKTLEQLRHFPQIGLKGFQLCLQETLW